MLALLDESLLMERSQALESQIAAWWNVKSIEFVTCTRVASELRGPRRRYSVLPGRHRPSGISTQIYHLSRRFGRMAETQGKLEELEGVADVSSAWDFAGLCHRKKYRHAVSVLDSNIVCGFGVYNVQHHQAHQFRAERRNCNYEDGVGATNSFIFLHVLVIEGLDIGNHWRKSLCLLSGEFTRLICDKIMTSIT